MTDKRKPQPEGWDSEDRQALRGGKPADPEAVYHKCSGLTSEQEAEFRSALDQIPDHLWGGFEVGFRLFCETAATLTGEAKGLVPPEKVGEIIRLATFGEVEQARELATEIKARALLAQVFGPGMDEGAFGDVDPCRRGE